MSADRRAAPWRTHGRQVELRVQVKPGASRDGIGDVVDLPDGPALVLRVRAVPEDGAANAAVARLVADRLGMAPSKVTLVSGSRSRIKVLAIAGDPVAVERLIGEAFRSNKGAGQ